MKTLSQEFKNTALKLIDSFCIIHHGLSDLGSSTNFLHSFKNIGRQLECLDVETFKLMLEELECPYSKDSHALNKHNKDMILSFLGDVQYVKAAYLNLTIEPDFIEKLIELKKFHQSLNTINVRSILYENCLGS